MIRIFSVFVRLKVIQTIWLGKNSSVLLASQRKAKQLKSVLVTLFNRFDQLIILSFQFYLVIGLVFFV